MNKLQIVHFSLITLSVLSVAGFALSGFFYYQNTQTKQQAAKFTQQSQERENDYQKRVTELEQRYQDTLDQLALTQEERLQLVNDLEKEKERVEEIEDEFDEIEDEYDRINNAVSDLIKLGNTDEELLVKYSKIYFLNENYIPSDLKTIDSQYVLGSKPLQIHADAWPFLKDMLEDAKDDDMDLRILSAYRSFDYQGELKAHYLTVYGEGANQFSADQGYSEHQLGTTVDFTNPTNGSSLSIFDETDEFEWLQDNAHKYGFTLSYPKDNAYYQYEPWHWRFVGTDLADDLYDEEQFFYDLDQRDINEYLLEIFD